MAGLMSMGTGGTHTHAASTGDKHIVLTLIKEEETCCLEKTVCVCDGDFAEEAERRCLS